MNITGQRGTILNTSKKKERRRKTKAPTGLPCKGTPRQATRVSLYQPSRTKSVHQRQCKEEVRAIIIMHHCICWGLSVQVSGDTTGPSKGHAPTWTHMYNLGSSHKHTHRFSYELLEGKDILMLIAYIILSTSI